MDLPSLTRKPQHLYNSSITTASKPTSQTRALNTILTHATSLKIIKSHHSSSSPHASTPGITLAHPPITTSNGPTNSTMKGPSTFFFLPDFFANGHHCVGIEFTHFGCLERCFVPCTSDFLLKPEIRDEVRAARRWDEARGSRKWEEEMETRMKIWEMVDGWFRAVEEYESGRARVRGMLKERGLLGSDEDLRRDLVRMGVVVGDLEDDEDGDGDDEDSGFE